MTPRKVLYFRSLLPEECLRCPEELIRNSSNKAEHTGI